MDDISGMKDGLTFVIIPFLCAKTLEHNIDLFRGPLRVLAVIGGLTLLIPGTVSDLIGLVIVAGIIALQVMQNKKAAREAV